MRSRPRVRDGVPAGAHRGPTAERSRVTGRRLLRRSGHVGRLEGLPAPQLPDRRDVDGEPHDAHAGNPRHFSLTERLHFWRSRPWSSRQCPLAGMPALRLLERRHAGVQTRRVHLPIACSVGLHHLGARGGLSAACSGRCARWRQRARRRRVAAPVAVRRHCRSICQRSAYTFAAMRSRLSSIMIPR
jgi:hypothetical protein